MDLLKRMSIALSLVLLLQLMLVHADASASGYSILEGKIDLIDSSKNVLLVDDKGYYLAPDLVVKTASGKKSRLFALYPGKRIRMEVEYADGDRKPGTIHTIYMLR